MAYDEERSTVVRGTLLSIFKTDIESHTSELILTIKSSAKIKSEQINIDTLHQCLSHCIRDVYARVLSRFLIQEYQIYKKENFSSIESFTNSMSKDRKWYKTLSDYFPSLLDTLHKQIKQIKTYVIEVLTNIYEHEIDIINKLVKKSERLNVEKLEITGDRHNDGKSTIKIKVGDEEIFYKPRSGSNDSFFLNVIKIIKEPSEKLYPKLLDYGCYSIHEAKHATPDDFYTQDEAKLFYQTVGVLLACCDLLNLSDIHYENIIVVNKKPIIIDLESILLPGMNEEGCQNVLNSNILPSFSVDSNSNITEKSGLSKRGTEIYLKQAKFWGSSDDFGVEFVNKVKNFTSILPCLEGGEETQPCHYWQEICSGYNCAVNRIRLNKSTILENYENHKSNLVSRSVIRNTSTYVKLLSLSYHPDYHYVTDKRLELFSKLEAISFFSKEVHDSEMKQLLNCDVPLFTSHTREMFFSQATKENYFFSSGETLFLSKLDSVCNERYTNKQKNLIKLSLNQGKSNDTYLGRENIKFSYIKMHIKDLYSDDLREQAYQLIQCNDRLILDRGSLMLYDGIVGVAFSMLIYDYYHKSDTFSSELSYLNNRTDIPHQIQE